MLRSIAILTAGLVALALTAPAGGAAASGDDGSPFDTQALVESGKIAAPGRVESLAAGMFDGRVENVELVARGEEHVRNPLPVWAVTLRKPDGTPVTIHYNAATLRILSIDHAPAGQ